MSHFLQNVERVANRLPHPMALFVYLCVIVFGVSALGQLQNWQAQHPTTGDWLTVKSLASEQGLIFIFSSMVKNFMGFAPVGPVVIMALAFSLAERSGLLPALIAKLTLNTPASLLAIAVAFLGVMSSIAVDSGYVVLLPLCAAVFLAAGRHPLAGLALGFACVSGGFSANLLVGPVDAMLSGISSEALSLVTEQPVSILANYYFMVVSVFLVVLVCVSVNRFWVEPYLLKTSPISQLSFVSADTQTASHFGKWFYGTLICIVAAWLVLTLPSDAILRNEQGGLLKGPFMASLVVMIALSVAVLATVYGLENRRFANWQTWVETLEQGIKDIAPYLVLMFVVAQFIAWFKWSELGIVLAIHLAGVLQDFAISGTFALVALMVFSAVLNLFIGSASAKWGLLAPVVIPAFYILGVEAPAVQGAYRVADSSTNIITPLMPYFPLVLAYGLKYEKHLSVGRLLTIMLPYAVALFLIWGSLLVLWYGFDWPLGPSDSK
ncbi:AbgT family transporter [Oceaniserpentilla sp. 4NH20-0058]|uniref:AbgT family transporter n=1 Tax=Oceaniserpentilla sp. 4NH20-0058 TaxID=3127660 RepID=UPI0031065220